ncbi:MAG: hypothetical protein M5U34_29470 [Chloroflexi bacterium]|nr:hypothetical protein [Chloroflexota bacterium]
MNDLLVVNGRLVTWQADDEIIENGALLLQNGLITDMGNSADLRQKYPDTPNSTLKINW